MRDGNEFASYVYDEGAMIANEREQEAIAGLDVPSVDGMPGHRVLQRELGHGGTEWHHVR